MSKILWAVDAFDSNSQLYKNTLAVLNTVCGPSKTMIEPVFLSLKEELVFSEPLISKIDLSSYAKNAEKLLEKSMNKLKSPLLRAPKVLLSEGVTKRAALQTLSNYAHKEKAKFIAVSTFARKGIQRLFIGSFAETLLLHSKVPLLLIHPKTKVPKKIKSILFPADLSAGSHRAFKKVLSLACEHHAEVILFHQIPNPIEPYISAGMQLLGGNYIPISQYLSQEKVTRSDKLKEWKKEAESLGLKASIVIEAKTRPISLSILKCAQAKKASLIAMTSESGALSAAFIGSIARQVVRESLYPVWVLHKDH